MTRLELPKDIQFFSVADLNKRGYSYYLINRMVEKGMLRKMTKSVYENQLYDGDTSDFAYVNVFAPRAVICLMSAARYYHLTTYLPDAVDIAVGNSMKVSSIPDWPSFHVYYFSQERYETGVVEGSEEAAVFRIYDMEKTVADILSYRNKVGIEETKEVLRNYLQLPGRDLNKLHRYSEKLGSEAILRTYLEVLL